jgi:hypothetical protein
LQGFVLSQWLPGVSGNPKGKPPGVFSTFSDTATKLLEKLGREELIAISDDEARLNKFPAFQCLVIRQLANALRANHDAPLNLMEEREKLYDRVMGKATQKIEADINVTTNESALLEGRRRISGASRQIVGVDAGVRLGTPEQLRVLPEVSYSVVDEPKTPKPKPMTFNQKMALKEAASGDAKPDRVIFPQEDDQSKRNK